MELVSSNESTQEIKSVAENIMIKKCDVIRVTAVS